MGGKFLVKNQRPADAGANVLTIWWVEPYNFSFSISSFVWVRTGLDIPT